MKREMTGVRLLLAALLQCQPDPLTGDARTGLAVLRGSVAVPRLGA